MNQTHSSFEHATPPTAPRGQLAPPPRWPPTALGAATPEPPREPRSELPVPRRPFGYYVVQALFRLKRQVSELLRSGDRERDALAGFSRRAV